MKRFLNLPIRSKLLGLIMLSSSVALMFAMTAIVAYDSYNFTSLRVRDLKAQADILARASTAALIFNDAKSANEYLMALQDRRIFLTAAIYSADGKLFASYVKEGSTYKQPYLEPSGYHIEGDEIKLFNQIQQNGDMLGTVYFRARLDLLPRVLNFAGIVFLTMICSLLAGLWFSTKLQKIISVPILEIAGVANAVIEKKDYMLRAIKYSEDEIGLLAVAFNQMLTHIQERDEKLVAINHALQQEIEHRTKVQEALKQNMKELARSNSELEQFAYVSSHDLQEPLRMVASYTQLLEKRYGDKFDEKGTIFLHYIIDGAKRMQQLIDDLLAFSRVGTRRKELEPVSSQFALDSALLNLKHAIQENHATILHDALPDVMGNPLQLTQLFQNLISNAIKFHGDKSPNIYISANKENSMWLFSVKDNGIGIEKEHFERIFVVFQRLHVRTEYEGSGIGLSICKKIVELHGGRIWVESTPGNGSVFYFTLQEVQ